jgi:hypothetical protein
LAAYASDGEYLEQAQPLIFSDLCAKNQIGVH